MNSSINFKKLQFWIKNYSYKPNKFRWGHLIGKTKTESICHMFPEEKLHEINAKLQHSPWKSLTHLTEKTMIFKVTCCYISKKESWCIKVNILWMCKECTHTNKDLLQHLPWCELISFWFIGQWACQVHCRSRYVQEVDICLPLDWSNDLWQTPRTTSLYLTGITSSQDKGNMQYILLTLQPQRMASMHHVHGERHTGFICLKQRRLKWNSIKKMFHCDLYFLHSRCRNCNTWLR